MTSASTTLSTPVLKKAIDRYYKQLQDYKGRADYELAVRTAFLNLLNETAHQVKWMLIPEQTIEGGIRPDGVLRDSFDLKRGIWEAKGPQSDLDKEIARKIATGYPLTNTIFLAISLSRSLCGPFASQMPRLRSKLSRSTPSGRIPPSIVCSGISIHFTWWAVSLRRLRNAVLTASS